MYWRSFECFQAKYFSKDLRKQLSEKGYPIIINRLLTSIKSGHSIHVINTELTKLSDETRFSVFELMQEHDLDFVDAHVVFTAKNRRPYNYEQNLLITGDNKMQMVAKTQNLNVWNCIKEETPS